MTLIVNWAGNATTQADPGALWSTKGGKFVSKLGIKTYFPLPMSYASSVPITGRYTVTAATQNRADLIAKELYQSEEYWWLVYWMNNIVDPFASLNVGDILYVADLTVINSMVN